GEGDRRGSGDLHCAGAEAWLSLLVYLRPGIEQARAEYRDDRTTEPNRTDSIPFIAGHGVAVPFRSPVTLAYGWGNSRWGPATRLRSSPASRFVLPNSSSRARETPDN